MVNLRSFRMLWSRTAIALLLFLFIIFITALVSGLLQVVNIEFGAIQINIPFVIVSWQALPNPALWIAIAATSASLAGFFESYLRRKVFVYYKLVNYPADHLKILHSIKGSPKTVDEIANEFDVPPSVAEHVLEDLWVDGLLQKLGDGGKSIYYFPFEKKLAQMQEEKKETEEPKKEDRVSERIKKFAKKDD